MLFNIKTVVAVFVIFTSLLISAEDEKIDTETEINPKLIKISVKKLCRTRKIRSKEEFPQSEGGIDYSHDDKIDYVTITINIENKNKASLKNYKIVTFAYGKSVTEKRANPELHKEFEDTITELKSRDKYKKEFKFEMVYDKSDDTFEKEPEVQGGDTKKMLTKAFGNDFYGYKVDLINEEGKVVQTAIWPGGLAKMLEKAEEKKK